VDYEEIRKRRIEEVLNSVQALSAMASRPEVQSVMAVFVKCTIEIAQSLDSTGEAIRQFDSSTTALTNQVIRLNWWLTVATFVGAVATLALAALAVIAAVRGG
jgi:hypothetical protein